MTWIALSDADDQHFEPHGLDRHPKDRPLIGSHEDDLLARGSLVIETRLPITSRPRSLVFYERGGDWPFHLSLQAIPGGGLILILYQGDSVLHKALNPSEMGRLDVLRLTYSWDAPARWGRLAVEQNDQDTLFVTDVPRPCPLRAGDVRALFKPGEHRFVSPDVIYMALSNEIEAVGPMPTLLPSTPIATPDGYRPISKLQRGDVVLTADLEIVPILHKITCTMVARGTAKPLHLRAPYFGLQQDIQTAPDQRLLLSGSEVEYLFGHEAVLTPVCHLAGGTSVLPAECGLTVTYQQLLLPQHEPILAAGTVAQSLYIGRLRRKPQHLAASLLGQLDRHGLPDHGRSKFPVLRAFDARVLAERRVA
ncbi:Hint domain-containing protein [Tropicibacter sp. Alg240-R139]|uniref:Hint domain-containing protein n=1 Tax=Tropicibacter sp. Alg240-R139 TaxID=2305991 RepID=UPI001F086F98|nr:Hint domain-containing protein [Tropicibacter sp. Alg240-R139]